MSWILFCNESFVNLGATSLSLIIKFHESTFHPIPGPMPKAKSRHQVHMHWKRAYGDWMGEMHTFWYLPATVSSYCFRPTFNSCGLLHSYQLQSPVIFITTHIPAHFSLEHLSTFVGAPHSAIHAWAPKLPWPALLVLTCSLYRSPGVMLFAHTPWRGCQWPAGLAELVSYLHTGSFVQQGLWPWRKLPEGSASIPGIPQQHTHSWCLLLIWVCVYKRERTCVTGFLYFCSFFFSIRYQERNQSLSLNMKFSIQVWEWIKWYLLLSDFPVSEPEHAA